MCCTKSGFLQLFSFEDKNHGRALCFLKSQIPLCFEAKRFGAQPTNSMLTLKLSLVIDGNIEKLLSINAWILSVLNKPLFIARAQCHNVGIKEATRHLNKQHLLATSQCICQPLHKQHLSDTQQTNFVGALAIICVGWGLLVALHTKTIQKKH